MGTTMKTLVKTTKCIFCDGHIPASYDQVYLNHMNDHHRAFVNIEFLFQISLLCDDDLNSLKVNKDLNIPTKSHSVINNDTKLVQTSINDYDDDPETNFFPKTEPDKCHSVANNDAIK